MMFPCYFEQVLRTLLCGPLQDSRAPLVEVLGGFGFRDFAHRREKRFVLREFYVVGTGATKRCLTGTPTRAIHNNLFRTSANHK
jgi:hypothetical protein